MLYTAGNLWDASSLCCVSFLVGCFPDLFPHNCRYLMVSGLGAVGHFLTLPPMFLTNPSHRIRQISRMCPQGIHIFCVGSGCIFHFFYLHRICRVISECQFAGESMYTHEWLKNDLQTNCGTFDAIKINANKSWIKTTKLCKHFSIPSWNLSVVLLVWVQNCQIEETAGQVAASLPQNNWTSLTTVSPPLICYPLTKVLHKNPRQRPFFCFVDATQLNKMMHRLLQIAEKKSPESKSKRFGPVN